MSQGRVRIRRIREKDLPVILDIEETAFPNPYPLGYLRFLFRCNSDTFLVAENAEGIAGYVIADIRYGNEGHIISIAVREHDRRKGIAKALIEAVEDEFSKASVQVVRLEVRVSNTAAIHLYESLGYATEEIIPGYYRDGEDALRMSSVVRDEN